MKKIGEGLYYIVYKLSEDRVLKVEKSFFHKQKMWIKWLDFKSFFRNLFGPLDYSKNLLNSKKVAIRSPQVFGNPKFVKGNDYEQDKVVSLQEYFQKNNTQESKDIFEKYILMTFKTWSLGFSDIVFNFTYNCGVTNDRDVILYDFNEVTFDKKDIIKRCNKKKWLTQGSFTSLSEGEFKQYVKTRMDESFTENNINKYWKDYE